MIEPIQADNAVRTMPSPANCRARAAWHRRGRENEAAGRDRQSVVMLQRRISQIQDELSDALFREKQARHLALHDDLTALPNRRYFRERLEAGLAAARTSDAALALIYLDLDGFKALNDAHGHDKGDRLLSLVAARLSHAVRAEDLVSRLGGDEFACLIFGVDGAKRLQEITATLQGAVSSPFTIGGLVLTVSSSIGIARYPGDGKTAESLLKAADAAMYRAKREKAGRRAERGDGGPALG